MTVDRQNPGARFWSFRWLRSRTSISLAWERSFHEGEGALAEDRVRDAERALLSALQDAETFEASDPRLTATLDALTRLYLGEGDAAQAIQFLNRSLEARERAWGSESPKLAGTLADLARAYRVAGRAADAERAQQRALALLAVRIGPDLPELEESLERSGLAEPPRGKR